MGALFSTASPQFVKLLFHPHTCPGSWGVSHVEFPGLEASTVPMPWRSAPTLYPRPCSGGLRGPGGLGVVPCPWASQTPHRFFPRGCTGTAAQIEGWPSTSPVGAVPLQAPAGSGRAPAAESCKHLLCTPGRGPHSVCRRGRACTSGREVSWVPVLDTHPQAGARHRQGCRVASGNPTPCGGTWDLTSQAFLGVPSADRDEGPSAGHGDLEGSAIVQAQAPLEPAQRGQC